MEHEHGKPTFAPFCSHIHFHFSTTMFKNQWLDGRTYTSAPIEGTPTPSPSVGVPAPSPIVGTPAPAPIVGASTPVPTPESTGNSNNESCIALALDMSSCVSYVSTGSTQSKPDQSCCYGFEVVLDIDARCICEAWKNSAQYGINIDVQRAISLPSACQILNAPSVSQCDVALSPVPNASPNVPTPTPISISPVPEVNLPSPAPSNWQHTKAPAPAPTPIGSSDDDDDSSSYSVVIGQYYIMLAIFCFFVNFLV